jgi:hypothetical protein
MSHIIIIIIIIIIIRFIFQFSGLPADKLRAVTLITPSPLSARVIYVYFMLLNRLHFTLSK